MKIDGTAISNEIKSEVKDKVAGLAERGKTVRLDVIIAGENPASKIYVRNKQRTCAEVGIKSVTHELPENVSQSEVEELIDLLNADPEVNGILAQHPFPAQINEDAVFERVHPMKDVDCFNPYNVGLLNLGKLDGLLPGTPAGVIELLKRTGIEIAGKDCAVLGRSNIVGKPMAALLMANNGTVTICHSKTKNLADILRRMDIIVAAIGRKRFVTADMIKEGAVLIDVGINSLGGKKICGDVDYNGCYEKAAYITPVPGGVGPMTIAMLMASCIKAWELQNNERA